MATVDQILDYKKKEEEDYYAILGCDENSTIEQIQAEYKVRALQYHPDKNEGNKEAEQKFQLLNEAKDVLCTPEKKCLYDKWKNSGIAISYKQWLGMKEHVQQSMHWSTPKTKDRMLESSGPSSLGAAPPSAAHRRASEGGANLHWSGRGGPHWQPGNPSEVAIQRSPVKQKEKKLESSSGGSSGPSSLNATPLPAAYRRASEGGANLYMGRNKAVPDNEV